jgi:UDP-galactopyranose mutase
MRMVAKIITEIQKAQKSQFSFPKNVPLLSWLMHGVLTYDEEELFVMSKRCEAGETSTGSPTLRKKIIKGVSEIVIKEETEKVWKNPLYGKKLPDMSKRKVKL